MISIITEYFLALLKGQLLLPYSLRFPPRLTTFFDLGHNPFLRFRG